MLLLMILSALAQDPEICHFERPVSATELRESMKSCQLVVGTSITIRIEDVDAEENRPGVGFLSNDSALTSNSQQTLDGLASVLMIRKKMNIRVVGYADKFETGDLVELSFRRAQATATYLVSKGISQERIATEAAGADKPLDTTGTAEGRARNRRVEFVVSVP